MVTRKIQLIANSTYTISLPKEWIKRNNLNAKDEIFINEQNNFSLNISPKSSKVTNLKKIELDIDKFSDNIDQILVALYHLGVEEIKVYSKNAIGKELRLKIRRRLIHMIGTEISFESKKEMSITIFLDISKLNITQLFYRTIIILDSTITNIIEDVNMDEILLNENEVDRIYNLLTKMISSSLIDANLLSTSKIKNIVLVPSYFLISKRLEHIGDSLQKLAKILIKKKIKIAKSKKVLLFVKNELKRCISFLLKDDSSTFSKIPKSEENKLHNMTKQTSVVSIRIYTREIIRHIIDIEEEIVNITFYNDLINKKLL